MTQFFQISGLFLGLVGGQQCYYFLFGLSRETYSLFISKLQHWSPSSSFSIGYKKESKTLLLVFVKRSGGYS